VVIGRNTTVTIQNSTTGGAIVVGAGSSLVLCASNVVGALTAVSASTGNNVISGSAAFYRDSGGSPEGPGIAIQSNIFGGSLNCLANTPAPSNYMSPNEVSGVRTGQCVGL
jgi:hypothetical protein